MVLSFFEHLKSSPASNGEDGGPEQAHMGIEGTPKGMEELDTKLDISSDEPQVTRKVPATGFAENSTVNQSFVQPINDRFIVNTDDSKRLAKH